MAGAKSRQMTLEEAGGHAVTLLQRGRLAEAESLCRQILGAAPGHAEASHVLGAVRLNQGRPAEAVPLLEAALKADPRSAQIARNLGLAHGMTGRFAEALAAFDQALKIAPRDAMALNNRGLALLQLGRAADAVESLEQAIRSKPDYVEAHYNLGNALMALDRDEEAVERFDRALALKPDYGFAHGNRGNALRKLGRYDESLQSYERIIALRPDDADAHYGKGVLLAELDRPDEAEACYAEAIRLSPRRAEYHRAILGLRPCVAGDPRLAATEALAAEMDALPAGERTRLHFALGKAYGELGEHGRAFEHLLQGNALKRAEIDYDEAATLERFAGIRRVFTPALMAEKAGLGDPSAKPVFILGMMRSGSTLVEQVLASHPQVFAAGELNDFGKAMARLGLGRQRGAFPDAVAGLSAYHLRRLGADYVKRLGARAPARAGAADWPKRITDKMPGHFQIVGLIHLALPEARIIHTVRDPVDTCLSCFSILFADGQDHTYDLGELGRYYRAYEALMAHWRAVLPEGVMLEVRYEDVVADLEGQARRIVAHCGLEWDDACLAFHETARPVRTASTRQVRQPIYATSIGRARPYEDRLGPLLEALQAG